MDISNKHIGRMSFFPRKNEIIKVNLSTPFLVKNVCKGCGDHPSIYYFIRNRSMQYDPHHEINIFNIFKSFFRRMCSDFYLIEDPSSFDKLSSFNFRPTYKSFNPKLHKNKGINPRFDVIEYLACDCGKSIWAFYDRSAKDRPEIKNRKSRHTFPNKFVM